MTRRLAAILAADVVAYSRLMETDEVGTLTALKAHREQMIDPAISEHEGRVVKLTGDGVLVEFGSVVNAVACALAVQNGMAGRNANVSEDRRIILRIGVHLGDVMVEGDDLYGDGVNVAARLEGLAEPGGICISQQALDQVETKLDLAYEDAGEQRLKNIARPVRVWRVRHEGAPRGEKAALRRKPFGAWRLGAAAVAVLAAVGGVIAWLSDGETDMVTGLSPGPVCILEDTLPPTQRPAIAVLPFENLSGNPEQDYFGRGIAEDLITDLSKLCDLSVVPSEESFSYAGQPLSVIASELGARYLVNGSVRRDGGRVRINAKLIATPTEQQIWADRYDRDFENIFALLDDVLDKVVGSLKLTVTENERRRIAARGTDSVVAHDLYLQARRHESRFTCEGHQEAMRLYEQALSIDPDYALAYARIANIHELNMRMGCAPADLGKAIEFHKKATDLDPRNPKIWWGLGRAIARLRTPEALKQGIEAQQYAIELDPYFADAYAYLGILYAADGRAGDGLRSVETAMRLNPRYPFWYLFMRGAAGFCLGDYRSAIADFEASRDRNPNAVFVRWLLAASYVQGGRLDDAEWEVEELGMAGFEGTIATIIETQPIQDLECLAHYRDGLRKAGIPEN